MKVHKLVGKIVKQADKKDLLVFDLEDYWDREALKNKSVSISIEGAEPYFAFFTNWGCPICGTTYWGIIAPPLFEGLGGSVGPNKELLLNVEITVPFRPELI
jgi:hypothetical protein